MADFIYGARPSRNKCSHFATFMRSIADYIFPNHFSLSFSRTKYLYSLPADILIRKRDISRYIFCEFSLLCNCWLSSHLSYRKIMYRFKFKYTARHHYSFTLPQYLLILLKDGFLQGLQPKFHFDVIDFRLFWYSNAASPHDGFWLRLFISFSWYHTLLIYIRYWRWCLMMRIWFLRAEEEGERRIVLIHIFIRVFKLFDGLSFHFRQLRPHDIQLHACKILAAPRKLSSPASAAVVFVDFSFSIISYCDELRSAFLLCPPLTLFAYWYDKRYFSVFIWRPRPFTTAAQHARALASVTHTNAAACFIFRVIYFSRVSFNYYWYLIFVILMFSFSLGVSRKILYSRCRMLRRLSPCFALLTICFSLYYYCTSFKKLIIFSLFDIATLPFWSWRLFISIEFTWPLPPTWLALFAFFMLQLCLYSLIDISFSSCFIYCPATSPRLVLRSDVLRRIFRLDAFYYCHAYAT